MTQVNSERLPSIPLTNPADLCVWKINISGTPPHNAQAYDGGLVGANDGRLVGVLYDQTTE